MKLQNLAVQLALASAAFSKPLQSELELQARELYPSSCSFTSDDPEVNIEFKKWDNHLCSGDGSDEINVEHGICENFDYGFGSFKYEPDGGILWNDNDEEDCRCFLFVHLEKDCQGAVACRGPLIDSADECIHLEGYKGWSAVVNCDDEGSTMYRELCSSSPWFQFEIPAEDSD